MRVNQAGVCLAALLLSSTTMAASPFRCKVPWNSRQETCDPPKEITIASGKRITLKLATIEDTSGKTVDAEKAIFWLVDKKTGRELTTITLEKGGSDSWPPEDVKLDDKQVVLLKANVKKVATLVVEGFYTVQ